MVLGVAWLQLGYDGQDAVVDGDALDRRFETICGYEVDGWQPVSLPDDEAVVADHELLAFGDVAERELDEILALRGAALDELHQRLLLNNNVQSDCGTFVVRQSRTDVKLVSSDSTFKPQEFKIVANFNPPSSFPVMLCQDNDTFVVRWLGELVQFNFVACERVSLDLNDYNDGLGWLSVEWDSIAFDVDWSDLAALAPRILRVDSELGGVGTAFFWTHDKVFVAPHVGSSADESLSALSSDGRAFDLTRGADNTALWNVEQSDRCPKEDFLEVCVDTVDVVVVGARCATLAYASADVTTPLLLCGRVSAVVDGRIVVNIAALPGCSGAPLLVSCVIDGR
jgi:hypothetical protein